MAADRLIMMKQQEKSVDDGLWYSSMDSFATGRCDWVAALCVYWLDLLVYGMYMGLRDYWLIGLSVPADCWSWFLLDVVHVLLSLRRPWILDDVMLMAWLLLLDLVWCS
ncbi:hypothetical protein Tco_0151039 [Tanacetum coccineum]